MSMLITSFMAKPIQKQQQQTAILFLNQLKGFLEKLINCEILQKCFLFQVEQGENLMKC